jgi:hypothetical protein
MISLSINEHGAAEPTDWMKPPGWSGNFWGPAASQARFSGQLPPIPISPAMTRWNRWGRLTLREGDIVFRLGDARTLLGCFPLSYAIASATDSRFSHTGIVAIEGGEPIIYDCSSSGIQKQPFHVWMLDCVGTLGVKRLRPEYRKHIPGVIGYCRDVFARQVPFDCEFRLDDSKLYCLEMTEKAFRSQGLALSQPVLIGDWENLSQYPITLFAVLNGSKLTLEHPISLDQPVYVPGNDRQGVWASPLLETVFTSERNLDEQPAPSQFRTISLAGDLAIGSFIVRELRRSYHELPLRLLQDFVMVPQVRETLASANPMPGPRQPGLTSRR